LLFCGVAEFAAHQSFQKNLNRESVMAEINSILKMAIEKMLDTAPAPVRDPMHNRQETMSERDIAAFWGVSDRQVRRLQSDAVIQKAPNNCYEVASATKSYIQHLVASAKLRGGTDPELKAEKLRLVKEQADRASIQNAISRGEHVSAKAVEREWTGILRDLRVAMLTVPSRVRSRLAHLTTHDAKMIDAEIRQVLQDAANDA
jgi:terminase small subunit / prophage DNA-packing protein